MSGLLHISIWARMKGSTSEQPERPGRRTSIMINRGYFNDDDAVTSTNWGKIIFSLCFPFLAHQSASCFRSGSARLIAPEDAVSSEVLKTLKGYPDMVNVNVIRIADFMSALALGISAGIVAFEMHLVNTTTEEALRESSYSLLEIVGIIIFVLVILDKLLQAWRMPDWTGHRALALRIFGPVFVPINAKARQAQQLIMALE